VDLDGLTRRGLFPQSLHHPGEASGGRCHPDRHGEPHVVVRSQDHFLALDAEVEPVGLGTDFDLGERPRADLGAAGSEEGERLVFQMDPHGDAAGVFAGHPHRPGHLSVDQPRPPWPPPLPADVEESERIRPGPGSGQQLWQILRSGLYPRSVPEIIYTTYRLSRHYPPDRTVLSDISL